MGTTGFSASLNSSFNSVFSSGLHPVLGAVLAGLGFWPKAERTPSAPAKAKQAAQTANPPSPTSSSDQPAQQEKQVAQSVMQPSLQPLRVIRFVETDMPAANAAQMAGRMVISGRMSDVCAELDRLAA